MGFKVASRCARVERRGVSRSLRRRGAVPLGIVPAALAGRLRLPCLRPSRALCAGGPEPLPMLPVQEADILHGGHDLPRHQAAADAVVRGRPPDRNGEERDFLGRAGAPSRGQAADRLDHEAQDHGGDGAARGRHAAVGAGGDGRCLPRRRARRRQAGPWRAGQDALRGGGLHQPRGPAAQGQAGPGQGLPQARDRARRQALAGPRKRGPHRQPALLERARRGRRKPSRARVWFPSAPA